MVGKRGGLEQRMTVSTKEFLQRKEDVEKQ